MQQCLPSEVADCWHCMYKLWSCWVMLKQARDNGGIPQTKARPFVAASFITPLLCFIWDSVRPQSLAAYNCRTAIMRQKVCLHIFRAVEGDDWSSVIDGQTAETIANANPVDDTNQYPIATPFARASVHRSIGDSSQCLSCPLVCAVCGLQSVGMPARYPVPGSSRFGAPCRELIMCRNESAPAICKGLHSKMEASTERRCIGMLLATLTISRILLRT